MPRFYFNIRDGDQFIRDEEGTNVPDTAAAREEAVLSAKEILASDLFRGEPARTGRTFEVTDEAGKQVLRIPFTEAIEASVTPDHSIDATRMLEG